MEEGKNLANERKKYAKLIDEMAPLVREVNEYI